jgi:hypothetical protein
LDTHRWTLRVRSTDHHTVSVFARKRQFEVGAPVDFDDEGGTISALEYALGALGAELAGGLERLARRRRMQLDHVEAVIHGELNDPLAAIGVIGAKGHAGIEWVRIKVYVSSNESEADLERLWQEVLQISPLIRTFQSAARLEVSWQAAM